MHSRYFTPRQWNPYVPAELKEPFAWAHRDDPVQRRSNVDGVQFPFRSPLAILLCGCVLLVLSIIGITLLSFSTASAGMTVLAGVFFIGGSVFVVYIGVARMRWERRFTQRMGFSPFDRRPTDVPGLAQRTDPL
ncbi:hypothetical protein GCM10027403_10080 [Arthrobacter tecti]